MKIKAKWNVSYESGTATFDLEDVGCESEKEWNALSDSEKNERLQKAIDSLPEAPYMMLDTYYEV